jgi:nitrogen fixation protein FixH
MHISWGIKIAMLYCGFVALIIIMVSMAMNQKIDLVSKDYYEQELNYQKKIDKTNRSHALHEQLSWQVMAHAVVFKFPEQFKGQAIKGSIYFFRPSDETMDTTFHFASVDSLMLLNINTAQLKDGLYKMQVDWQANQEEYYNEGILKFN